MKSTIAKDQSKDLNARDTVHEEQFLDYTIKNTGNGDGYVLFKHGKKSKHYECNLGNFSKAVDARKAAVLFFMIARPEEFATHMYHLATGIGGTCHSWYKFKDVCEKEKIKMPVEIVMSNDMNCLITFNGEKL